MSRRIAIFAGPSLPPSNRPDDPALTWFPPAGTGDLLAKVDDRFDTMCLIDGYFDHRPAPWHKELLVVLASGIRLIGASSMGALRAAELDGQGMEGVGVIYHAYRTGLLTGDDEVALIHGPERLGWAPASVPMVEVRATLVRAVRVRLLATDDARRLRSIAQDLHYVDRDWPLLEKTWIANGLTTPDLARKLAELHVPLKEQDAEACVAAALERGAPLAPFDVPQTSFLRNLRTDLKLV